MRKSVEERFWGYVTKGDGCWIWSGCRSTGGYGRFYRGGSLKQAHRVAYELTVGPIPEGLQLDHRCHGADATCQGGRSCPHRPCVRPDHLQPVTGAENVIRGLSPFAANARKTHCPKGHRYTAENTYVGKLGRQCATCRHDAGVAQAVKDREARSAKTITTSCRMCGIEFSYVGHRRRVCSMTCRRDAGRIAAREHARRKRATAPR